MASPPTLAEFGHASLTINGRPATGLRRLLVALVDYDENPAISETHGTDYYLRLAFGDPRPPFSTDAPVNPASLTNYFLENSHGRFRFARTGLVTLNLGALGMDPGQVARCTKIMERIAVESPDLFSGADFDSDGTVEQSELLVLLVENFPNALPDTSGHNPVTVTLRVGQSDTTVKVHTVLAGGGPQTPFFQFAHELSHAALGTADMYNSGEGHGGLTLMAGYSFTANDQYTVHLDPWHKFVLGWIEPRVFRLSRIGSAELWESPDGNVLLWDDSRGAAEYFLLERRRPDAPGLHYDSDFVGDGVVIWRVRQGMAGGVVSLGPPNLVAGRSGVWSKGSQTPFLRWTDGESTGAVLAISDPGNGRLKVEWGNEIAHTSSSRHRLLFHGGNGSDGVGGITDRGVFYGITTSNHLEWNRYDGNGAGIGEPGVGTAWHPNTGNFIGRGFHDMIHLVGCGNGAIMAVHRDGNLYWYQYAGTGEPDISGTRGWLPNSGHVIGNGFNMFSHIFAIPSTGLPGSIIQLFGIDADGNVRWYGYAGQGEHDPTGHLGWIANSGNQVAQGWQNLRHVHASSNVIFVVDELGLLRWHMYEGRGRHDPDGATGWRPNSGNPIGHGWDSMAHIFGSFTDVGGFGHIIFAVDSTGELRWYRYTGSGESDSIGEIGWDPRSGNHIGSGW
jgi:M6 family metalloprotease-like protein